MPSANAVGLKSVRDTTGENIKGIAVTVQDLTREVQLNAVKEVNESRNATTAEKNLKVQEMLKKLEVEMNNLRVGAQKRGQVFNLIGNILNGIFGLASKAMPNKVMHVGQ